MSGLFLIVLTASAKLCTMQSKPRFLLMDKDDLVWQKPDEETEEWES